MDPLSPTLAEAIDFLVHLAEQGLGYSAINTARSALSSVLGLFENQVFGKHHLVIRLMRGIFNDRPPTARYSSSWDVNKVLNWLKCLSPVRDLDLRYLTLKLVMLMALVSGQRCQSLHLLDLNLMKKGKDVRFAFDKPLKHFKQGKTAPLLIFEAFPPDRRLCVLTVLKEYLCRTTTYHREESKLFVSFVKPHKKVSKDTIGRWVKLGLRCAGVNETVYKAHSTRMASASKAAASGIPLDVIMSAAGWSRAGTFAKFYCKPTESFAKSVLA